VLARGRTGPGLWRMSSPPGPIHSQGADVGSPVES